MVIRKMALADVPVIYQLGISERAFEVVEGASFWTTEQLSSWVATDEDVLLVRGARSHCWFCSQHSPPSYREGYR